VYRFLQLMPPINITTILFPIYTSPFFNGNDLKATFLWFDKGKYEKPEQVKWWKGSAK